MDKRMLGELEVSAIGLGCMPMSWAYNVAEADPAEVEATLHRAVELGITLLDTADVYGDGHSESLIAQLRRERSEPFYVATKAGRRLSQRLSAARSLPDTAPAIGT